MGWTCFYDNVGLSIDDMMRREWNATGDNGAVFALWGVLLALGV